MKIDIALTAVDCNKQYLYQLPITKLFWNEVIGIPLKVILIAKSIPKDLEDYKDDIILFPPIKGLHTAFQAQCVRLLYPALMKEYKNSILITDMDLIPLSKKYFLELAEKIDEDKFLYYRNAYMNRKMIGISNVAAKASTYQEIYNINSFEDVISTLKSWYSKDYTTSKGNTNWYTDQKNQYKYVMEWNKKTNRFIHFNDKKTGFRNYDFKRFEPYKNFVDDKKRKQILEDMKNEKYFWIHSPKNFNRKLYCLIEIANKMKEKEETNNQIIDESLEKLIKIFKNHKKLRPVLRLKDYKLSFFKNTLKKFMIQLNKYYQNNFKQRPIPNPQETNKIAVIVEPREHQYLELVIRNVISNLSNDWGLMIFHGTNNNKYLNKILDKLNLETKDNIILSNLEKPNLTIENYTDLLKSTDFWGKIPAEHIFIFQTDGLILQKTNLEEFLEYDYIGAPWLSKFPGSKELLKINPDEKDFIGNGGVSLRRKSTMIELCEKHSKPYKEDKLDEDMFFAKYCLAENKNLPTQEIAKRFSVENIYYETPICLHDISKTHFTPSQFINLLTSIDKKHKWKFY